MMFLDAVDPDMEAKAAQKEESFRRKAQAENDEAEANAAKLEQFKFLRSENLDLRAQNEQLRHEVEDCTCGDAQRTAEQAQAEMQKELNGLRAHNEQLRAQNDQLQQEVDGQTEARVTAEQVQARTQKDLEDLRAQNDRLRQEVEGRTDGDVQVTAERQKELEVLRSQMKQTRAAAAAVEQQATDVDKDSAEAQENVADEARAKAVRETVASNAQAKTVNTPTGTTSLHKYVRPTC